MDYEPVIQQFILNELSIGRDHVDRDEPLISSGIVDSVGLLRLVAFLEKKLGVVIEDEEVVAENFESVAVIARFVAARAPSGPGV